MATDVTDVQVAAPASAPVPEPTVTALAVVPTVATPVPNPVTQPLTPATKTLLDYAIDAVAIIGMVVLLYAHRVDTTVGVSTILAIVGGRLALRRGNSDGNPVLPPSTSAVLAILAGAWSTCKPFVTRA